MAITSFSVRSSSTYNCLIRVLTLSQSCKEAHFEELAFEAPASPFFTTLTTSSSILSLIQLCQAARSIPCRRHKKKRACPRRDTWLRITRRYQSVPSHVLKSYLIRDGANTPLSERLPDGIVVRSTSCNSRIGRGVVEGLKLDKLNTTELIACRLSSLAHDHKSGSPRMIVLI